MSDEKITESELLLLPNQLMMLPHAMSLVGHKTIADHARYIHGSRAYKIYLRWLGDQSQDNWEKLINLWGGESVFTEIKRGMAK